ncbi:helix-turn-helix transcriptional regulator [Aquimarina sp. TRL1]|uniref:winged helix-turn-helix transcriptional regulator n=1 Tax=Aquimarina sp. (strain TRL1) TaxID=2736252 RepID=UPI00158EF0C8|nr:helix-turn-helix domain-containing protein [Aquimarina sp. TRL1]QKX05505.1 helix-turn-helix transcriptional regulator [Aquimarina sp. TRL1]
MGRYERKTEVKEDCGIEKTLQLISGKWKPAILSELMRSSTIRLKDVQKGLPEASKRSLTTQLGEMVTDDLLRKEVYEVYPKKTVYSLTEKGKALKEVFEVMNDYAKNFL